jgi:hypothetical protein
MGVAFPDRLGEALDQRAEALLAFAQARLDGLVLADVDHEHHAAAVFARLADARRREHAPPAAAVLADHLLGVGRGLAALGQVAQARAR